MSNRSLPVEIPVTYHSTIGHGKVGKFRFPEQHIITYDGLQAVPSELITDKEALTGTLILPQYIHDNIRDYVPRLNRYSSQEGLYTGRVQVVRNCAEFVSYATGVEFDKKLLNDTSAFNNWQLYPQNSDHIPTVGEVMAYTRPASNTWTHWGIGAKLKTDDNSQPIVIGLGGANGHGIIGAASPDITKALGFNTQNIAEHPSQHLQAVA